MGWSTGRELGRRWSSEQGGAAGTRLKKETSAWNLEVSEGRKRKARASMGKQTRLTGGLGSVEPGTCFHLLRLAPTCGPRALGLGR